LLQSPKVLTREGSLEQNSFQLMPEWVDGWSWKYIVSKCIHDLSGRIIWRVLQQDG